MIALFGAPGGKAHERREALPRVAGAYADHIVYTEEDPAHDSVEDICAELVANTPKGVSHEVIIDREMAVAEVLNRALADRERSVVLLLAKGDETRQHRGDEYPEVKSDLAIARMAVAEVLNRALADRERSVVLLLAKGDETRQHRGDEYPEVKSDLAIARGVLQGK